MLLTCRITGDGGARIKQLKRRWPNVFIYVEQNNTLTVRGTGNVLFICYSCVANVVLMCCECVANVLNCARHSAGGR